MLWFLRIPVSSRRNEHILEFGHLVDFNVLRSESTSPHISFLLRQRGAGLLLLLSHLGFFLSLAVIEES